MITNKLLDSQIGFYYGTKINSDKSVYNIAEYVEIKHSIDLSRLKRVIYQVMSNASTLNIHFYEEYGVPYQQPSTFNMILDTVDLSHREDQMTAAIGLMEEDASQPFTLDTPPLFRQKILVLSDTHLLWYFCSHHILLDGYSTYLLLHQIAATYRAMSERPKDIETTPTFAELIDAETTYRKSSEYQANLQFWQTTCTDLPYPATMALANTPSGRIIRHAEVYSYSSDIFETKTNHPSWPAKIIAAIMVYMYLSSGDKNQVIGVPMIARGSHTARQALTCKTNVLPLALSIEEFSTGLQLAHDVERKIKKIKKHQLFRSEEIKILRGNGNHSQLFNVVVNIIPFEAAVSFDTQHRSVIHNVRSGSAQDLVFNLRPDIDNRTLRLEIDADSGLYNEEALAHHSSSVQKLSSLLHELDHTTVTQLRQHFLLSQQEGEHSTANPIDVMQHIRNIAIHYPLHTALCTPGHTIPQHRTYSYARLLSQVDDWSAWLANVNTRNTALLIDLPQGPEAIICMLAALSLNLPFVNLNTTVGDEEYQRLLEPFADAILVTLRASHRQIQLLESQCWCTIDTLTLANYAHFTLFRRHASHDAAVWPLGLGYIMFTSGTTGNSKGVMCSRASLNTFIASAIKRYAIEPTDRVLQFAPLHFDACIEEIFMTLVSRAGLYIAPALTVQSFPSLLTFCITHQISILDLPTAYFNELMFALNDVLVLPPTIRMLIVGGENLSPQARNIWFSHQLSGKQLINSYGPTEATVVATTAEISNDSAPIPIGQPMDDITILIVGSNLQTVPQGCNGELLIAGPTVAMGYLNEPQLNEEKFLTVELNGTRIRAYRTGDIGCLGNDGKLYFLGRKNREVKIAGQRVNMNDIETCISALPGIVEVGVLSNTDDTGTQLYAHYHAKQALDDQVKHSLYGRLSNLYIPRCFIYHQTPLAKLANGKLDYRALARLSQQSLVKKVDSTTLKTLVHDIWLATLGNAQGDFFTLGGESLQAIKIINVVNAYCQFDLSIHDIFEHPFKDNFYQHLKLLALSRYGLSQEFLDIRCAISRCLSTEKVTTTEPILFIERPDAPDERRLLATFSDGHDVRIVTPDTESIAVAGHTFSAVVFNIPDEPEQYLAWLKKIRNFFRNFSGQAHEVIFMCNTASKAVFRNAVFKGYHHEKLSFLLKSDQYSHNEIKNGIEELIELSVRLGHFPRINFDTATDFLSGHVTKRIGIAGHDSDGIDHQTAFATVQQRNPGVQLCELSLWLNKISDDSQTQENQGLRTTVGCKGAKP